MTTPPKSAPDTALPLSNDAFFDDAAPPASCTGKTASHLDSMGDGEQIAGVFSKAGRIDSALAAETVISRERIKGLMAEGKVTVSGRLATSPKAKVAVGERFTVHLPPPVNPQALPQDIPLTIVYEDAYLIVVDKEAGMVVHPAAGNPDGTLVNALLHHCAGQLAGIGGVARPGIVHRIDKDTSGLLVVAKTDAAHEGLARQFADHSLERAYFAVVNGVPVPASGTVDGRIGRSDADRKKMAMLQADSLRGKHAVTHYTLVEALERCALIECRLETGRTHQVRVHMASIGHSLVGDPVYGKPNAHTRAVAKRLGFTRQALHAAVLGFVHPVTGEHLRFTSKIPADMRELIDETSHSHR